jgi:hypothetical protein
MTSPVSSRIDNLAFLEGFADSVTGNRRVKSAERVAPVRVDAASDKAGGCWRLVAGSTSRNSEPC